MTLEELGIEVKAAATYVTTCPQCSSGRKGEHRKLPCLSVKRMADYSIWNCHHCAWSGSTIDHERYQQVRDASKMPKVKPALYSKEVSSFLASKQISPETALKCGCYEYSNEAGKTFCMPYYYLGGNLVNVMFRKMGEGEKKVWQIPKEKGTKACFWGLEMLNLTANNEITITEGQTDRMTWVQHGYENILSVPMGAPSPGQTELEKKLEYLTDPNIVRLFEGVEKFYLCTDNDAAGIFLRDLIADKIGKDRCYILPYPAGYKDSNEVHAGNAKKGLDPLGKEGIDDMRRKAYPYPLKGILPVYSVRDELMLIRNHGFKKGLISGIPEMDKYISIQKKRLIVHTGTPGSGKSAVERFYLSECCKVNKDLSFGLYTPESRPPAREYAKIAEIIAGGTFEKDRHNSLSDAQIEYALQVTQRHFTIVNPEFNNFETFSKKIDPTKPFRPRNLDSILNYMLYLKKTKGIFGFVIDAWNKLDHQRTNNRQNAEEFISQELDRLLEFLDVQDLFCWIIAHPTKMERVTGGNYKIPSLYDIKGSSAWNEKADIGIISHRNMYKKTKRKDENDQDIWELDKNAPTYFVCEKMKFQELGEVGQTKMWMDRKHGDRFVFGDPEAETYEDKKNKAKAKENKTEVPTVDSMSDDLPF